MTSPLQQDPEPPAAGKRAGTDRAVTLLVLGSMLTLIATLASQCFENRQRNHERLAEIRRQDPAIRPTPTIELITPNTKGPAESESRM